ncbi:MAG: hypothetical protein ABIR84_01165 [Candidatus Nitrotoga sp.]
MYESHPIFVQPENENVRVWRYMDFTKFVSFIESRCLYFTRADKFDDPFEGSSPKMNVYARNDLPLDVPPEHQGVYLKNMTELGPILQIWRRYHALNCWHINEHESAALWKLYFKNDEGIAIQSTYRKLRDSFTDDEKVFLGVVKYIDYEKEGINTNSFSSFVHKRKSFEHEREVRALVEKLPISESGCGYDYRKETISHGVKVRVDVEQLIEKIYLAPGTPSWLANLVKSIAKQYKYTFEVEHSKLDQRPFF